MQSPFLLLAALSGAVGVALGAFGAHALKAHVSPEQISTFTTGVQYQMYHALALGLVGLAMTRPNASALVPAAGWLFVIGTLLFSGSLYALVLARIRWLGAITPFGGVALIAGWLTLAMGTLQG